MVFQPHRYSRSTALLEEFGAAFFLADQVIVTEIYAAGEEPIAGVDGALVVRPGGAAGQGDQLRFCFAVEFSHVVAIWAFSTQ